MLNVYMADLRHNYGGVLSTDCMPLSVGYMKAVMDRDLPADQVQTEIFAYPSDMLETMTTKPGDVVMVSNYVWNEALSRFFLRRAKQLNPKAFTVMGGPNIPVEPDRQIEFVEAHPEIDLYVLGEGDFLARDIIQQLLDAGCDRETLLSQDIPSSIVRRPDGKVVRNDQWDRNHGGDVNDIPSPWLTGVMDKFFDNKLSPIIETNRGCPFRCSFCVQGTGFYNKVTNFEMDRLRDEILYIGKMIHEYSPSVGTLRIADANYGMYERDTEISSYIGQAQRDYGWPTFIDATTGKNRPENIIRSMEQVNGALVLYQAVQSLDEDVLRNIRRSNIKLEAYGDIQVHVRGRGLRSSTDLILGLPGESLKTHITALHQMIDLGTDSAHCFQAMMLKGADMETMETRQQYKFDTRYRVLPKNYGEYGGEKVFDVEEVIVGTDTLPFEDYIQCRKHHLTFSAFWNDSWFSDFVKVAKRFKVKPSEWLIAVLDAMDNDKGPVGDFCRGFVEETKGELFDTREDCIAFYSDPGNFKKLNDGQIGDNLMYKYRALASFFIWEDVCKLAADVTRKMLVERGADKQIADFDAVWADLHRYVECEHATGTDTELLLSPVTVDMRYDIKRWLDDGAPDDTAAYDLGEPQPFEFKLTEEGARELEGAMKVWTSKITGLSKLVTRIRVTSQVRHCEPRIPAAKLAAV